MNLIGKFSPGRLAQMQRDVEKILVYGIGTAVGQYVRELRMVTIDDEYVLDEETTPAWLAGTLVHEAQHARLFRLGFGYEEAIRGRIERLCYMAERNFANRLPDGGQIAEYCEKSMRADNELYSDKQRHQVSLQALRDTGCPEWLVQSLDWIHQKRSRS